MKVRGYFRTISALFFGAWLLVGCAHPRGATVNLVALYKEIQIGMSRSEVRALLGEPSHYQSSQYDVTWYLPPPEPGTIAVWFDGHGRVGEKYMNPSLFEDK